MKTINSTLKTISVAFLASGLIVNMACSDDAEEASEPPEQFSFSAENGDQDHSGQCPSEEACDDPSPMTMCSMVRRGEVMAFVEVDASEGQYYECDERPFRHNHAVNEITVTGIIAGNSDFQSADELYSRTHSDLTQSGTFIVKARELDGRWWERGSTEIEPGSVDPADSSGVFQNIPNSTDELIDAATAKWDDDDYQLACDTDESRMKDDDAFEDLINGEHPACTNDGDDTEPRGPANNQEPDLPAANNQQDGPEG